ncbi:MAG: hypothetical protein O2840_04415 [bacterium]|nr:hypothetical protein [bacterium]
MKTKKSYRKPTRRNGSTHVQEFRFIRLVHDLKVQRAWYEKTFDWPVVDEWSHGVMFDTGVAVFELIQETDVEASSGSRIAISVPDVWSLFQRIKDHVTLIFPLRDNSWGDTSFRIVDPEGFPITFFTPTKPTKT